VWKTNKLTNKQAPLKTFNSLCYVMPVGNHCSFCPFISVIVHILDTASVSVVWDQKIKVTGLLIAKMSIVVQQISFVSTHCKLIRDTFKA